jgi:hypothetical protein
VFARHTPGAGPMNPPGTSYPATAALFVAGGLVTAVFSGSLYAIAQGVSLIEVLAVGIVVPSFTWLAQLAASSVWLDPQSRRLYARDLAWVCLLGSVALLPSAFANLLLPTAPLSFSVVNVVVSVLLMAALLFLRTVRHGLRPIWPVSWCIFIAMNMSLFAWVSRHWWG